MAKSIRSKRRQRVLAVRREKYRAVERKKCWDHQLKRQREKMEDMDSVEAVQGSDKPDQEASEGEERVAGCVDGDSGGVRGGAYEDDTMETEVDKPRFSKRQAEKLSRAWSGRHDHRKRKKRLVRSRKDKW